ncbi:RNA-directed DNA polymerase, eukaryota [Tanacetum coccineum]
MSIQNKSIREHGRRVLQDYLLEIDLHLDKGEGLPDDLPNRAKIFHDIGVIEAIKGILVDGKWIDNPDRVKREFYNHFAKRFSAPNWSRFPIKGIFPRSVGADSSHDLEDDISDDEIKKVVWDCGSDKSSGPDGFTFEFFFNLAPNELISHEQIAFIKGRQILDEPFILNEIVSWCKSRKEQALLFKVDFQKAFNSRDIDRGMFAPIIVGKNNLAPISHLFYVDDAMFIGKWSSSNVNVFVMMLHWAKNLRIPVGIPDPHWGRGWGCNSIFPRWGNGDGDGDGMRWRKRGMGMVNSILIIPDTIAILRNGGSLHMYYMSLFKATDGVLSHLERLRTSFFLKAEMDELNMTWVSSLVSSKLFTVLMALVISLPRHKVIGNGNNYKFLFDKWLGDVFFKVKFNRRPRGGIEKSQFQELSLLLSSVLISSSSDRWFWTWSKLLPIKLNVFAWHMFLDKLPTRINISNRGLDVPCVLCPNYGNAVEYLNHLFYGFSMVLDLFQLLGRWWNIDIINLIYPVCKNSRFDFM